MTLQNSLFDDRQELLSNPEKYKEKIIESQELWNQELLTYLRQKVKDKQAIYLPGNTASLKNSKEIGIINTKNSVCCNSLLVKQATKIWICSKCKKIAQRKTISSLRSSDLVLRYKAATEPVINVNRSIWEGMIKDKLPPYKVGFYFIRESRNTWDYNNVNQVICDMAKDHRDRKTGIVTTKWIPDDDMRYIKPYPLGYHYNKKNPGAVITLMDDFLYEYDKTH